jgi:hypothetical protein
MKKNQKRAKNELQVFGSIRKPVAPPGHPLGNAKPEEKAHPSQRKVKHKHRDTEVDE